jgi:hypothetical protein
MKWATAKDFKEAERPIEVVEVPGIGAVKVIGLTAGGKDEYENRIMNLNVMERELKMTNARAILLMMTIYDQHGNQLFGEKDLGKIATFPVAIVDPLLVVARRLSAMGVTEIKELVKNSLRGQELLKPGSDSDSPDISENPSDGSAEISAPEN